MKDPRRWILVLLALSAVVALVLAQRGPAVKAPHSACLTTADCLRAERCYVTPSDDGFAKYGVCVDPCTDDAQCGGQRCLEVAALGAYLTPLRAAKTAPGRERVCVP